MSNFKGPGAAYRHGGFAEVWRWAKGHGVKRWLRAKHWAGRHVEKAKPANKRKWKNAEDAYAKKVAYARKHKPDHQGHLDTFDGHEVPHWIIERALKPARASGLWKGVVFSGYRSPEYSTSLCMAMCGAPTCLGRCAGANSNHSCPPSHTGVKYEGAVDVSDYYGLRAWCAAHGYPLRGGGMLLPADLPHFSRSGR